MIGERIKEIREKNGLTQALLAKKLGVSRSAVNAWEMGISAPSVQYLIELAKLFKVSTDFILELESQEMLDISFLDDDEKAIIYSLLNYFNKFRNSIVILDKFENYRIHELDDFAQEKGLTLQGYLTGVIEEVVQQEIQQLRKK